MRLLRLLLPLLLAACRTTPDGPPTRAPALPRELNQLQGAQSEALTITTSLCDEVGPRLAGSAGDAKAVAWGLATMQRLGLEHVRAEPVTVQAWVRGEERAAIVSPVQQRLVVTALGGSVATPDEGLEAEVLEVTSFEALDALGEGAAAGRILFVNIPLFRTEDGSGYGKTARVRGKAGHQGAKAGAVASLIRSVGTDHDRLPHTGGQGLAEPPPIPAGALSVPDAELLHRLLSKGPVRLHLTLTPRRAGPAQSANVVGEVVGRERPDEVVLLGAHLDSWDLGTGAHDDGAGVGIVLDVARQLLALPQRPRRTVRVVLYANEENGLAGGVGYGQAHAADHHVVALESDAGGDRPLAVTFHGPDALAQDVKRWNPWLLPVGVHVSSEDAHGGADISVLRAAGVPVLDVEQDMSRYFDWHHSANDTVDKLDPAQLSQAARAYASVTWLAAERLGLSDLSSAP